MATALIVLGGASFAYGAAMGVLYPARGFWLVWVVLAAALAGAGLAMRLGAWGQLPACARHVVAARAPTNPAPRRAPWPATSSNMASTPRA